MNDQTKINLLASIKRGKELFDVVASDLKRDFLIGGKTMEQWRKQFAVVKPSTDANPAVCKDLAMQLMTLYEEASFRYSQALAYEQMAAAAAEDSYKSNRRQIVSDYADAGKKLPGAEALDHLVNSKEEVADARAVASIGQVHKDFFKQILDRLSNTRKLLENISINNAVQAKLEQGQGNIPITPTREYE